MLKKILQKITRISLLVGLVSISTVSYAGTAIDSTYAIKNLLTSITETYPNLTVQEALSLSALLGIMSETDVQLHMYGTFTPKPDPKRHGRTMKVFDTTTPINQIARTMLDVLDDKLRSTVQASNPFAGIDGKVLAKEMLIINKTEVQGLINALEEPTPPKKKIRGKKGEDTPTEPEELSLLDEWWEAYRTSGVKGVFDKKKKFTDKILDNPSKESSGDDTPFIGLLKQYAAESANDPGQANKQKEELSKIIMTFLYAKDQKQKATGESHAIEDYYTTLLNKPFKSDYYTAEELKKIEKTLLGQDSNYTIGKDAKGLEDTSAYLAHFIAGDIAFLQSPFSTYEDKSRSFAYCAEATVRSIMNSLLYNPETGKLDITMLPLEIQKSMGKKFKDFIEKYPDPTVTNYYGNSLKEWLDLVSGLDGVKYKNGEGKDAYEISAGAGPKNLVTVLNHIFGTQSNSFEILATALEVKNEDNTLVRKVSFTPNKSGFDIEVTDHGQTVIQAEIGSEVNTSHASFAIKGKKILDLLNNKEFRSHISELSDYSQQDLYEVIFKPSTLNVTGDIGAATPLIQAIKSSYGTPIVKTMLAFGADPNFKGSYSHTPLEVASLKAGNDSLIHELLKAGAIITAGTLNAACTMGNFDLVKKLIPVAEQNNIDLNYNEMLLKAADSPYPSLPLVTFLVEEKHANVNFKNEIERSPLLEAATRGSLAIVKYLVEQGAEVNENSRSNTPLRAAILESAEQAKTDISLVKYLVDKHATLHAFEQDTHFLRSTMNNIELVRYLLSAKVLSPDLDDGGITFLQMALQYGKVAVAELLIQHSTDLNPDLLNWIIVSRKLKGPEQRELIKKALEKGCSVSALDLEAVKENATEDKYDDEKDKLQKKQWAELLPLLEQAQTEQSFGLNLTTQEQKCITECVVMDGA